MTSVLPQSPQSTPRPKGQMTGWHALLWFLGFFGAMFVVNGIFLWTAITTFPGEDIEKSYLAGLEYNRELARRAHQEEAGWKVEAGFVQGDDGAELRARLLTREETPLAAANIEAVLRHPADRAHDRVLALSPLGGGEYAAGIGPLSSGLWTIIISAETDEAQDGSDLIAVREVFVP